MTGQEFTNWMRYRTYYSYNTIIVIVGDNRSGKSMMGCALAESWDDDFNIKKICFTLDEFLDFVKKANPCWLVFDEVGVTFSAYEWWSIENRIFGHVSEAFGKLGINLILTLPSTSMLSRHAMAMTHFFIVMKRRGIGRVYMNWKNPLMGKTGFKGIGWIQTPMPSKELVNAYEEKKSGFLSDKSDEWRNIFKAHQLKGLMKVQRIMVKAKDNSIVVPDSELVVADA